MKTVKNILVGFVVSFLGSIPLGYLNIIGFEIYYKLNQSSFVFYLLGVVFVEIFIVFFTLKFVNQLVRNDKLMRVIEIFTIAFLLFLAYFFHSYSTPKAGDTNYLERYSMYSPFLIGVFLNGINFMQLPFWSGWNLYLINGNYISVENKYKYFFIIGTSIGTFFGMFLFVLFLGSLSQSGMYFSSYIIPVIVPLIFVALTCIQVYKVFKKRVFK